MKIIAIILSIVSPSLCINTFTKPKICKTVVSSSLCLDIIKPKHCMNCKHFIQNPRDIKYSKCGLFKKLQEDNSVFIDNIEYDIPIDYYYCSIARNYNHMCGKKGKKYEE